MNREFFMTPLTGANIGVCSWSLQAGGLDDLLAALETLQLRLVHLALGPLRTDPA